MKLFTILMLVSFNVSAACYQDDVSGRRWVTSDNLKGTTTATIKQCNAIVIAIPEQDALCSVQATSLTDKVWGGISGNPAVDGTQPCLFIKTIITATGVSIKQYSASRVKTDGTESCNP